MKIVYAVSSGSYSDYQVHVICNTRSTARSVIKKIRDMLGTGYYYEDMRVEEIPLIESTKNDVVVRVVYSVEVDSKGKEMRRWGTREMSWAPQTEEKAISFLDGATARSYRGYDVALKAARDKLGIKQAEDAGVV